MKVLIAEFDLFKRIGGGQTFYRQLILNNPNIYFYYFRSLEPEDASRPENAIPLVYKDKYVISDQSFYDLTPPKWIYGSFATVSNMAASVAGQDFDIIDIPDYEQFGTLIRPALRHHNVGFERIALSMHGGISRSARLNWSSEGKVNISLDLQERMQYKAVDIRYGISKTYLDEWRGTIDLESHYLNPLCFIPLPKPALAVSDSKEVANINFVGRTEKCKGPDIFVELAWWLPRSSFSAANIIGPDSYDPNGVSSGFYLRAMARHRLRDISILPAMSHAELANLFVTKSITILPSRFDTFNLIALESLFSGCPTAIGSGAGVIRFLKETFPKVPFLTIDVNKFYSCLPSICSVLENYEDYRQRLVDALLASKRPDLSGINIESIYQSSPVYDNDTRAELDVWYSQLIHFADSQKITGRLNNIALRLVKSQPSVKKKLVQIKHVLTNPKPFVKSKILSFVKDGNDVQIAEQGLKGVLLLNKYKRIFNVEESTERELTKKIQLLNKLASNSRIDRIRLWREIARLESIRGNELIAATYQLRSMRLLGYDRFGDLAFVLPTLKAKGFSRVALVAEAMFSKSPQQDERCAELLEQALRDNQHNQSWEYEFVDDRRELAAYRTSVIVSLYKAATKLPLFLQALQHQTLIQAGATEVILIDSGSPDDEYAAFQQCMASLNIPVVYARCAKRETIQSAWNRGIALSRSPYLAFLGVDEAIVPDCLEVLAAELDADPSLDWVQGNSLVTNVDRQGRWVNDIMLYDREGYRRDLVYLETCYLSWVGSLYRRSIHDRFGYYDASFTAAGDTEFKGRVLPFIKTKSIPRTLGIFWNYPDERTTQHPRAEIEDLRSWYLHRTLAGVKYAFATRDPREAEKLLYSCLKYRKSYCKHWSTDIEYAYNVATFLQEKMPDSSALKYVEGIKKLLDAYRSLDWIAKVSTSVSPAKALHLTNQIATQVQQEHRGLGNQVMEPIYKIFNDNRYEQHSNLWSTDV